jgi:Carboxypeptidase regulatory-like domain
MRAAQAFFIRIRRRRLWFGAAIVVSLSVLCPAQNAVPPRSAPAQASGQYRIAGKVLNASTGEPVRRATVAALGEDSGQIVQSTETDAEGRFALEHMGGGKYPLTASRRGYSTGFYDEHQEYNSAIVTGPDQDTSHLVFRLTPSAVLRGVVTGDGGDPAENASVILFKREQGPAHGGGADEIRQADGAMTDDTGAYEFSNLGPGEYYLAVVTSPWYAMHRPLLRTASNEESPLDVAYPVTFFDSTTDEASAAPIRLEAGSREEADISLHAVPALRLQVPAPRKGSAIVQPELRTMVFGTQVSAESGGAGDPMHTGMVEFSGIAPGRYELVQGDPPRISELDASSSQAVDPSAGAPAVMVSGTLRTTGGEPVPGNVNVVLDAADGRSQASLQINAHNGDFRFDAVPAGVWSLSAQAPGSVLPVVAVITGGGVTPGNQVAVKDRSAAVEVIVSRSLSRVQGFARRDGNGVAGAMIVLVPRQPAAYMALLRRDQSDSDGSFNLRDVPAGQYTVIAIEDGWKLDWTDREAMARYVPRGEAVTVPDQAGGVVRLPEAVPVQ